jgi:hypothetical protein
MKLKRKIKRIFNLHNFVILLCVIALLGCIYILFKQEIQTAISQMTSKSVQTEKEKTTTKGEVTEKQANKLAAKRFKELGEKVKESELKTMKIQRDGEEYYYISSKENTLEVKIKTGEITRVNSVLVGI